MQLTLLFTLGLSLQASAVPYPAGSEKRDDELQRRTIKNPEMLNEVEVHKADKAVKQATGKSIHDKKIEAEVTNKAENTAELKVTLLEDGDSKSSASSSSTPPTPEIVQNTAVDKKDSSDPLANEIPVDDAPSKSTKAKASSPQPASKPAAAQQGIKAKSESETTSSSPASTGSSPLPPVEVGEFREAKPDQYDQILNDWRDIMGLPKLTKSDILEKHAKEACDQSSKTNLNHTSYNEAQVMAPGNETSFEWTLVGGWLCEMADLPGIWWACQAVKLLGDITGGWDYQGQTGHAEHLSNGTFTKVGCANANEVWTCSLSF
ncbi:hypothetical protein CP532_1458 [Ophiocordyceps camponoti-leonardi (nom. inval.)]|nr:hypothetical protein CP532_1458 [Ophiocordyceps camponoti-leonardi (nom. inval.)]